MKSNFNKIAANRIKLTELLSLRDQKQVYLLPEEVKGLEVKKILFGERTDSFKGLSLSMFTTFSYLGKSKNQKNGKSFHHVQAWAGGKKYILVFGKK